MPRATTGRLDPDQRGAHAWVIGFTYEMSSKGVAPDGAFDVPWRKDPEGRQGGELHHVGTSGWVRVK